jgi:hypothetical protein
VWWSAFLWAVPVFGLAVLAAYMDIESFFRKGRISYVARNNGRFLLFLLLNGAISSMALIWARVSDRGSAINQVIQVEAPWAKMFVVGFGVPLLLRSKLFSFGQDQVAAGPAFVYDWLRLKALYSINTESARIKGEIATRLAGALVGRAGVPEKIKELVDDYVRPFASDGEKAQIRRSSTRSRAVRRPGTPCHPNTCARWFGGRWT